MVFVREEHPGKAIGVHDHLVERNVLAAGCRAVLEHICRVCAITVPKTTFSFPGDRQLVTGAIFMTLTPRARAILAVKLPKSDSERMKTTGSVFLDTSLELVLELIRLVACAELDNSSSPTFGNRLDVWDWADRIIAAVRSLLALVSVLQDEESAARVTMTD